MAAHLVRACHAAVAAANFPERGDYSYVPLAIVNGIASRAGDDAGRSGGFEQGDSDSQDEA